MEEWAEIRRLYRAEGLAIKAIVLVMGILRNTVRSAIASDAPPKYERTPPELIFNGQLEVPVGSQIKAPPPAVNSQFG